MISLFCRMSSLLQGSFAKETYDFKEPANRSHPICGLAEMCVWLQREAAHDACMHLCVCVCMRVYERERERESVCVCVCVCVCVYVRVHMQPTTPAAAHESVGVWEEEFICGCDCVRVWITHTPADLPLAHHTNLCEWIRGNPHHICVYAYIYIYICICVCACVYIYIYIYTYVSVYIHTYIHRWIHTYIHTYTHTCRLAASTSHWTLRVGSRVISTIGTQNIHAGSPLSVAQKERERERERKRKSERERERM